MVGAGFSRNAEAATPDTGDFPLWRDISKEIFHRLYPQDADTDMAAAYDPLCLAQEYETGFGRSDRHKLLQELVRDNEYNPGDVHQRLLRLPWRDVFTTNWDTLLERTAPRITERGYSVVQNMDEIPLKSQPRIVKLHGSFPSQFPLIFTEEDYRTYPIKFAPFVNTVQQAMMETVFCLIGFSGDDPNFLQWSGWVRDNLGAAAPKIYLVGWLDLSNHRRRMLEDRGVVPIDLARHPQGQQWPEHLRHQYATQWALHTLENGKPYDTTTWPSPLREEKSEIPEYLEPVEFLDFSVPQAQPERQRNSESPFDEREELTRVKETLKVWEHNRRLYPGWLAFPSGRERGVLSRCTDEWEWPILNVLPKLAPVERLCAIRELIWRREILLEPLTPDLEAKAQEVLLSIDCEERAIDSVEEARGDWPEIREAWRTVGFALLTDARMDCKRGRFEQRLNALEPFANDHIDVVHRLQHERCLWDIFSVDFESLNQRLDNWKVVNCDPVWMLRKAALLTEVGRIDESKQQVQTALNIIRENYARNGSIANASRESWALASALNDENQHDFSRRWETLASSKCDAIQEIDFSSRDIKENDNRDEAPHFDLGVRNVTRTLFSGDSRYRIIAAYRGVRLLEVAGLPPTNNPDGEYLWPLSLGQLEVLTSATEKLATIAPDLSILLALRACSDEGDKTLERVLARTHVATLSEDSARMLAEICERVVNYALPRLSSANVPLHVNPWIRRIRVALEALSRLILRLPTNSVAAALELSIACLRNQTITRNVLYGRPVSNLLRRSWNALPNENRAPYTLSLLAMPFPGLDGIGAELGYQDPGFLVISSEVSISRSPDNEDQFQDVVQIVINALKSEDNQVREQAVLRAALLVRSDCLTDDEKIEMGQALWSKSGITNPDIFTHKSIGWVYLVLPEHTQGQAERSFRAKFLSSLEGVDDDLSLAESSLYQVGLALDNAELSGYSLPLSTTEQKYLFDCIQVVAANLMGERETIRIGYPSQAQVTYGIRSILAKIEMPKDIATDLYEKTKSMRDMSDKKAYFDPISEASTVFIYVVMLGLIKAIPERVEEIAGWIRLGLASDDDLQVSQAISTLRSWMSASASDANSIVPPPEDLVREVGLVIATRRKVALQSALSIANWIFESGDTAHRETISQMVLQGLSYLAEELRYDRQYDDDDSVPTVRFLCAQLAKSMAQKGYADSPAISQWLEIAKDDPLPEVRYAIISNGDDKPA